LRDTAVALDDEAEILPISLPIHTRMTLIGVKVRAGHDAKLPAD
jgi:hypothetical protein